MSITEIVAEFRQRANDCRDGFHTDSARMWDRWADEIEANQKHLRACEAAYNDLVDALGMSGAMRSEVLAEIYRLKRVKSSLPE